MTDKTTPKRYTIDIQAFIDDLTRPDSDGTVFSPEAAAMFADAAQAAFGDGLLDGLDPSELSSPVALSSSFGIDREYFGRVATAFYDGVEKEKQREADTAAFEAWRKTIGRPWPVKAEKDNPTHD